MVGILRGSYLTPALGLRVGKNNVRKLFDDQVKRLTGDAERYLGDFPTLLGETGIPMDLDGGKAYDEKNLKDGYGDYESHIQALDALLSACDASMLNYTLWHYDPYNSHRYGDNWNREDLSVWSRDDIRHGPFVWRENDLSSLLLPPPLPTALHANVSTTQSNFLTQGARALAAFCRPYPLAIVGFPTRLNFTFDVDTAVFELDVRVGSGDARGKSTGTGMCTEVYLPWVHYRRHERSQPAASADGETHQPPLDPSFIDRLADGAREYFLSPGDMMLVVDISEGRFEVGGQVLKWWYDDTSPPSGSGVEERIVKLKVVKRVD